MADRNITQALARAFHQHEDRPDGLLYRACHDDHQLSMVLFERASNKLAEPDQARRWIHSGRLLDDVLDRYRIALIDA